jgi:hypothetical protein
MKTKISVSLIAILIATTISARNIYIRPNGDTQSWAAIVTDVDNLVITLGAANSISTYTAVSANTNIYFAAGTYYMSATAGFTIGNNVKFYGGYKATDSSNDLAARPVEDKDGNGIVEPWEFKYETIITHEVATSAQGFTGTGASFRMAVISGTNSEMNGITLTDFNYNNATGKASAISLGVAGTPSAANNVVEKAGILRLCTLKKLKSTGTTGNSGVIISTNKYSLIDQCLIEECVAVGANSPSAVYLDTYGGTVRSSVLRNNANGSTGTYGAIYATAAASSDMDAIIENCIIYNNYGYAQGLRGTGVTGKRGIQIINSTIVNNQSGNTASANCASVELINTGTVANCIIAGDFNKALRATTVNNYVVNTAYESLTGTLNGSANVTSKTVADFKFVQPTSSYGAMIPDFTTPFDQTKYDAIRKANFKLQDATSAAVVNQGVKALGTTYSYGSPATTVNLTATIPTTDIFGNDRPASVATNLGAYQYTQVPTEIISTKQSGFNVRATNSGFIVNTTSQQLVSVYNVSGQLIKQSKSVSSDLTFVVNKGFYVVKVANESVKVIVK